jgi:CBS domain-containing protein
MKVCDILMKQGCVEEDSIEKALKIQAANKKHLEEILVEIGAVKESELKEALSLQSDLKADRLADKSTFLETIEPFHELDPADLGEICRTMEWKEFAVGESVLKEGTIGSAFYILKHGLAKILMMRDADEKLIGFLGEGDFCGATALLSDGVNPSTVTAIEQTLCLAQDGKDFAVMIQRHPRFANFFNELIIRQTKKIFTKLLATGTGTIVQVEPFLYSKQVRELVSHKQVFCSCRESVQEAGEKLINEDANRAIVVDDKDGIIGTVGLRELLRASLVEKKDPSQPVDSIVERDYTTIRSDSFFFDALHEMMKRRTDTLIVVSGKHIEGLLTSLDLLKYRGREVLSLIRNIDDAGSYEELNLLRQDVESVLRVLIADGALASHACKIVSELNDKMVRRVIKLSEEITGPPPLSYAWLGLGSEGRKEQTLITDQDNAILFDDAGGAGAGGAAEEYFRILSERIVNGLNLCGFPLCKGNIMATNPKYFGSLSQWKKKAADWINIYALEGKDLVDIYTFLDFRAVHGDGLLEEALKTHTLDLLRDNYAALQVLAQPIVSVPIPLGFFKNFIVEKNGKYKNTVNVKTHGLLPLTTCIKLLACHTGIGEANTLERIGRLVEEGIISTDRAESVEQAFETFLTLKIRNNLSSVDQGKDLSNNINPSLLSIKQKQLLKDAFLVVSELQKTTKELLKVVE